ncbi:hypothetical protein [Sanyastnella coralliicola]|uniref:hypothetical protein n=1 Tax=Sanyastnella coralliicola TaxID=3069118 RepID=UPI0027B9A622|nr:hypothetical protein [Longitalea sp. SCSIO 12813]
MRFLLSLLLSLCCLNAASQDRMISCIKLRAYHTHWENDSTSHEYLRTLWYDSCDSISATSKQWQFNEKGDLVDQRFTYDNIATGEFMDVDIEEDGNESYFLVYEDGDLIKRVHMHIRNDQVMSSSLEHLGDGLKAPHRRVFEIDNEAALADYLQSWCVIGKDSLSVPAFPDLSFVEKKNPRQIQEVGEDLVTEFKVSPQGYRYGATRTPKYIRQDYRRVKSVKSKLHERWIKEQDRDVTLVYDVYFTTIQR